MNNTMFAEVRKKSQKPEDLYAIIEMMFPGKRLIEVFARNHNLRFGVFSVGN
jgi:N6-adenosine-specific RNA methylase IME4